ncbi:hypothetical protein J3R30DRAFT_3698741 [Lentinula aciculospora]|uniref:Uncharacterized protein n=1 Tax=Lentinula aciculospora TaxID=153920 RepID=A0A9W9DSP7_9AGAR|nr:hypothetical protein J3R30DRAFT_3698741 [Lentinula aciculospora]
MNRGSFSSSSSSSPDDPPRRGRSRQMDSSPLSTFRDSRVTRSSVLPSGVLPYLRRLDLGDSSHPPHKEPLLVLKLSSSSFLDSEVNDDISRIPLYTIRTNRNQTSVIRSVGHTTAGEIEWPVLDPSKGKGKHDGVIIQMRSGRRKPADTFLRPGSILSAPRKFKIPGYSRSLKWKAVGSSYWCLAASAKGPIAILDPAAETLPPRLKIFETLHDKYEGRPMMTHQGVSILLLDYVVVTALLLMTDIQEWMVVQKHDGEVNQRLPPEVSGSDDFGPRSAPPASTSALQWRKVIYGEPLYPKRQSSASTSSHVRFPRNPNQFAKILNGDPIYPTLHSLHRESSSIDFSSSSESESDHETESEDILDARIQPSSTPPRAPSPSAESVLYPLTTASAPSHTYLDPSFYNEYSVPPVPPLPAEYASSHNIASPVSASTFRRFRELPRPPPHHSMIHRSRSSPPRPHTSPSSPVEPSSAVSQPDRRRPSIDSTFLTRNVSQSQRTLPQPPPIPVQEASSSHLPLRHSQSSTRPLNTRTREKHSSQCPRRTLPPTPITVSHPDWMTGLRIRKRSHNELAQWFNDGHEPLPSRYDDHRQSMVFEALDCPPPAYNSLEFAAGTSLTIDSSSSLPPPPPVHDLQGSLQ